MPRVVRAPKPVTPDGGAVITSASGALAALVEVELAIRTLEVRPIALIAAAQQHGASWEDLGTALGVSRQAAWERYRDRVRATLEETAGRGRDSEPETLHRAAGYGEVDSR